jgi:hypothetical protein
VPSRRSQKIHIGYYLRSIWIHLLLICERRNESSSGWAETVLFAGEIQGRLPYITTRRGPFNIVRTPPFTHMLGPVMDAGEGKQQTRLMRRLSIARALIDQLPPNSFFHQHLDPTLDDGLALADGLAFQDRQFAVSAQYTFEIDCRQSLDQILAAMYLKTRQHTRRAEKAYTVHPVDDSKN